MPRSKGVESTRWVDVLVQTAAGHIIACPGCQRPITEAEIAILTRQGHAGPFDAWCADCALTLMEWSAMGANRDEAMSKGQADGN